MVLFAQQLKVQGFETKPTRISAALQTLNNITYHVVKGQHKSFALWLAVRSICSHLLLQLVQVKHFIQAVVIIADHIKNNMAIIFKGIDLMEDSHRTRVEFDPYFLLCLSVNKMNQGLMSISDERMVQIVEVSCNTVQLTDTCLDYTQRSERVHSYAVFRVEFHAAGPADPPQICCGHFEDIQL